MKKTILAILVMGSILGLCSCGSEEKKFGVCTTKQDAINMMIASQAHGYKLQKDTFAAKKTYEDAYGASKQRKLKSSEENKKLEVLRKKMNEASSLWVQYVEDTSSLNRIINDKKYQQACDSYIEIAQKYNFNLESAHKTTVTVQESGKTTAKKDEECEAGEASVALMFFIEDARKEGKYDDPEVQSLIKSAGINSIQNPSLVCQKLKGVSKKIDFSYVDLMQRTKLHLKKSKKVQKERGALIKSNENNNKKCSANDAIELSFKREDYEKKFFSLYDKWTNRIRSIRDAKIYDSTRRLQADRKRKEVDEARSLFFDEFRETVEKNAANIGKYDLACENYVKLVKKNDRVLVMLKKEYMDFHNNKRQQVAVNTSPQSQNNQVSRDGLAGAKGSYSPNEKYNAMVNVVNTLSPKIRSSFATYAKSCGTDKKTRQKTMYSNVAGTKVKIPNNYIVINYYDGHYKNTALRKLNEALASKGLSRADTSIKKYKDSMMNFTKIFTEIAEYYKMKDYADDDFKKGDQMHAPLMQAYESFLNADNALRVMLDEISDAAVLQRINSYKENSEYLFYYVEKAQYLSKKFYRYANHKKDYMTLDSDELKKRYQEMRIHYDEFKKFKLKNETIFKDNNRYKGYLDDFGDYLSIVRDFQLHVKSKKRYDEGEEDFLKHVPEQARAIILSNRKGSLSQVLKAYNELVDGYNELNM